METAPFQDRASPRVQGICEHLERARFFVSLAREQKQAEAAYRLRLAAVYSCRALADLMLEAAEKQEVKALTDPDPKVNRQKLEDEISKKLPFYTLLEHIRIHDFHRFGIAPPDPAVRKVMLGGPVKLTAQKGMVAMRITSEGVEVLTSGGSKATMQRPLLNEDGAFFDDQLSKYVALEEILDTFLGKAPDAIAEFEKSVA